MVGLCALVERVHAHGLWIRFYTLDGVIGPELSCHGWFYGYNFGSLDAARFRWRAAKETGVDSIASDQYELLHARLNIPLRLHRSWYTFKIARAVAMRTGREDGPVRFAF